LDQAEQEGFDLARHLCHHLLHRYRRRHHHSRIPFANASTNGKRKRMISDSMLISIAFDMDLSLPLFHGMQSRSTAFWSTARSVDSHHHFRYIRL
jgi:hypothetical protein